MAVLSSRAYGQKWLSMQRGLTAASRCSSQVVFDDRHHNIHLAHPDAVVRSVANLVQTATATTA
jgi:hypothetical protein